MPAGVAEMVTWVEGPRESSSLWPSGGVNSTRTRIGPGPISVTGRSERWAPWSMIRSAALATGTQEIGRASCRERGWTSRLAEAVDKNEVVGMEQTCTVVGER